MKESGSLRGGEHESGLLRVLYSIMVPWSLNGELRSFLGMSAAQYTTWRHERGVVRPDPALLVAS